MHDLIIHSGFDSCQIFILIASCFVLKIRRLALLVTQGSIPRTTIKESSRIFKSVLQEFELRVG